MGRIAVVVAVWFTLGCQSLQYYGHALTGHTAIIMRSRPIDTLLEARDTPDFLRQRLRRVNEILDFAATRLHLPAGRSYRRYADVGREHVAWNVFAAPRYSVEPLSWCYPVVGCVAYRGFFSARKASAFAASLRAAGHDVFVGGIDAYSTLGRLADPVLSTYIDYPEAELAGLLFHELSHQLLYVEDDTTFNESFATAVELAGARLWLERHDRAESMTAYLARRAHRERVAELMIDARRRLAAHYRRGGESAWLEAGKRRILDRVHAQYRAIAEGANMSDAEGLPRARLNNAYLAVFGAYHGLEPAFSRLLASHDGDFAAFYDHVRALARLPGEIRHERLADAAGRGGSP